MYLKDKETGVKYRINTSTILGLSIVPTLSLFIYGMLLSLILMIVGIPSSTLLLILVLAYVVEAILQLFKKLSPAQIIACVMTFIMLFNIMMDIAKRDYERKISAKQQFNDMVRVCNVTTRSLKHIHVNAIPA